MIRRPRTVEAKCTHITLCITQTFFGQTLALRLAIDGPELLSSLGSCLLSHKPHVDLGRFYASESDPNTVPVGARTVILVEYHCSIITTTAREPRQISWRSQINFDQKVEAENAIGLSKFGLAPGRSEPGLRGDHAPDHDWGRSRMSIVFYAPFTTDTPIPHDIVYQFGACFSYLNVVETSLAQHSIGAALAGGTQSPGEINSPTFLSSEPAPYATGTRTPPERTVTKDERASGDAEGVERFQAFDERIRGLDLKLQAFANAVRQLGSSVGLLNAAYHLRARLRQIQYFFQENAAELFDGVPHAPNVGTKPYSARKRGKVRRHMAVGPENNKLWSTEIEDLPGEMENLAKDLDVFLNRLNDVPEFTDEAVNASIKAFEGDLWAIVQVGVPTIRFSQKHTATGLQNLSTVATFFSGVTATTLQSLVFSIASAINSQLAYHCKPAKSTYCNILTMWSRACGHVQVPEVLCAMVGFDLDYAYTSVLPRGLCNRILSRALWLFTYSSDQSPAVSAVVTSFTVVTSSALLCVGLWFASERWTFARTKGSRWLLDILEEHGEKAGKVTGITPTKQAAKRGAQRTQTLFKDVKRSMTSASERVVGVAGRMGSAVDVIKAVPRDFMRTMSSLAIVTDGTSSNARGDEESQDGTYRTDSPTAMFNGDNSSGSLGVNPQSEKRKLSDLGRSNEEPIPEHEPLTLDTRTAPGLVVNPPSAAPTTPGSTSNSSNSPHVDPGPSEQPQPNARLRALTRRVIHTFRLVPHNHPPSPPVRSMSSPSVMSDSRHRRDSSEHELIPARIQTYVPMLRTLRSSQLLTEHVALVKHLQFSPDGKFLATCSWDRTALIWRVGAGPYGEFELMHKLVHTARVGGFVGQVAWSPNGEQLLTKQLKSIKVWSSKAHLSPYRLVYVREQLTRNDRYKRLPGCPKANGFCQSNGKRNLLRPTSGFNMRRTFWSTDGTKLQEHHLPRLQVWDAAVVPDEERLVAVATLIRTEQERRPVKSRHEKRILSRYSKALLSMGCANPMETEEGNYALVSYENKAPPQAWRIDKILREGKQRLVLAHSKSRSEGRFARYPVDFAGPSYFGGVKDTFVLAASKSMYGRGLFRIQSDWLDSGGEIYIWERSSGVLLHSLKAPDQEVGDTFLYYVNRATNKSSTAYKPWTTTAAASMGGSTAPSPEPQEIESPGPFRQEHRPGSPPISPPGSPRSVMRWRNRIPRAFGKRSQVVPPNSNIISAKAQRAPPRFVGCDKHLLIFATLRKDPVGRL
ncbi:WD40 domain-containing protein [Rhizoctonia solani AG-1 IA]|uniref:WD40 domain-containing protein n=1 Tax=Thanatephorus cucumeris (strain AG1-IA) TaxID=983506 RepID=L8WTC2_THACA|nr:WD40 domain-containing protein [Rhizoctonia solani AG-1 IA]